MAWDPDIQLADAILLGDQPRAKLILEQHPELVDAIVRHPSSSDDVPALILASSCGASGIVDRLISMGADKEARFAKEGWRALHIAAQRNHIDVAHVLLNSGAMVDSEDNRKAKPIQWALKHKHFEFAELLLQFGADINIRWRDGYAFLNHEAKDGRNDTLRFMLQHGADANIRDQRFGAGNTPLHCAARNDRFNAAVILLEFGADVNAKNDAGLTPLDMTKVSKRQRVTELLLARGGGYGDKL